LAYLFALWLTWAALPGGRADEPATYPGEREVRVVAWSPGGRLLAAGYGVPKKPGTLVVWDVAARKPVLTMHEPTGVPAVAFAPDGKTLAIGMYNHSAKLLEAGTGKVRTILQGHEDAVRSLAFSPDGKTLATGSWDRTVKLWEVASGTAVKTLTGLKGRIVSVAYSPEGKWIAAGGSDEEGFVWEAATGKVARTVKHGGLVVRSPCFSADGRWLVTGGYDGTIRLWEMASGSLRAKFGRMGGLDGVAYHSPSGVLVGWNEEGVHLRDATLREPTAEELKRIRGLIRRWDDDRYEVREAAGRELLAVGFLADAELNKVMQETPSAEVRIRARRLRMQLQGGPQTPLRGHARDVTFAAFAPDGKTLATGSNDGTVKLWDLPGRKEIATLRRP
jgi:WD40 repeat protein